MQCLTTWPGCIRLWKVCTNLSNHGKLWHCWRKEENLLEFLTWVLHHTLLAINLTIKCLGSWEVLSFHALVLLDRKLFGLCFATKICWDNSSVKTYCISGDHLASQEIMASMIFCWCLMMSKWKLPPRQPFLKIFLIQPWVTLHTIYFCTLGC